MTAPLVKMADLWQGSNSVSFTTIGHVLETDHRNENPYFSSFSFLGPRYRSGEKQINRIYDVSEASEYEEWRHAWNIDPAKHELVVDCLERIQKRADGEVALFKFDLSYSISQVNTMAEEYAEIRRWNALGKLTDEEIKLLKLEKEFVYLKLKYATAEQPRKKPSNY